MTIILLLKLYIKFFIKDFFSKCDQIRNFLWILSHLPKKFLMENLFFCAVFDNNMDFLYEEGAPGPTSVKSEETFDKLHKLVQFKVWQEEWVTYLINRDFLDRGKTQRVKAILHYQPFSKVSFFFW